MVANRTPRVPMIQEQTVESAAEPRSPGLIRVALGARKLLEHDRHLLTWLVIISFIKGLLEAFIVLLVVQMAVALAGGEDYFAVRVGPLAVTDIPLMNGVVVGLAMVFGAVAILIPVSRLAGRIAATAQLNNRQTLLRAYLDADWKTRSQYPDGHLQELLTTYTLRGEQAMTQLVIAAMALCGLVAILLTAFLASPLVALATIVGLGGVGSILWPLIRHTRKTSSLYATSDRAFAGRVAEVSRVTPELAAFDVADEIEVRLTADATVVARSMYRMRMLARLTNSLFQYIALGLVLIMIGLAAVFADGEGLATMGTVLLLLVRALAYGQQFQGQVQAAAESAAFLEGMDEELKQLQSAKVSRDGLSVSAPTPLRLQNVRFGYLPTHEVLSGIDLEIAPGETIAIVGRSGAGKSTIVQLLLRLHRPTGGSITADGVPLDDVSPARWAEMVAYVPQDNKLVTGTVADNIRFFRPAITDETIRDAAARAHLDAEVLALPYGYETMLGTGIRELSGGQRQRLGIARALAGNPQLLILDEPTSALDARSEALVTETLAALRGAVATVIVAHRPATTAICDRVMRIADGQAVPVDPDTDFTSVDLGGETDVMRSAGTVGRRGDRATQPGI